MKIIMVLFMANVAYSPILYANIFFTPGHYEGVGHQKNTVTGEIKTFHIKDIITKNDNVLSFDEQWTFSDGTVENSEGTITFDSNGLFEIWATGSGGLESGLGACKTFGKISQCHEKIHSGGIELNASSIIKKKQFTVLIFANIQGQMFVSDETLNKK